mmetsp:Transcript_33328/g.51723  ORF Transcript_33328/g.51723 Transcript_33328/m.51723 type:complete len:678 (-) Transcript_33328:277-2310(-)
MREDGAGRSLDVDDLRVDHHRLFVVEGRLRSLEDESAVDVLLQLVVLLLGVVGVRVRVDEPRQLERRRQDRGKIEVLRLGVPQALVVHQQVRAAHQLVHRLDAEGRHGLPDLLGHHPQEVDHVLGHTLELLAQLRVLGGDADRAHVEVALAHHDAAERDEGGGREACLLGAQQEGHHDVTPRLDLPVCLDHHARAQVVHHERLVRLGQTQLPGQAGTLDAAPLSGARATIMSGDQDVIRLGLGHAGRNHPDTDFGDKLDADPRLGVRALEVVDELREVLDGVDVVVGRRRDEAHARRRVAAPRDRLVHLVSGELATLARLGALGHLDLELVGVGEVVDGHAKAPRGHLLDAAAHRVAIGHLLEALWRLATLARVALGSQAVHRHRKRRMRLHADGAVAHGPGAEALHDGRSRLYLVDRDRRGLVERKLEVPADGAATDSLVVLFAEVAERLLAVHARRVLHGGDGAGVVDVGLGARGRAVGVLARVLEGKEVDVGALAVEEALLVLRDVVGGDGGDVEALDARGHADKALGHRLGAHAERLEDLGALVRHERRDSHLREHLEHALADRLNVVGNELVLGVAGRHRNVVGLHLGERHVGHVWVDRVSAKARHEAHVVHLARLSRLRHEANAGAEKVFDEVVVHSADGHERRDVAASRADRAVGQDDERKAGLDRLGGL